MKIVPTYDQLMQPLLNALRDLGGSGSIDEIYEKVVELEKFDEETLDVLHNPEKSGHTEIEYRLGWARTYLKKAGYLENSSRGVWILTDKAKITPTIESQEIVKFVRQLDGNSRRRQRNLDRDLANEIGDSPEESSEWRESLFQILIDEMSPDAFERLTQRVLRESGFTHVEVTGRTGDGGIDGKGILRMNGLMSFRIAFQCKKYKGSVSASQIRDFRGATVGRVDRGMFITTGSFTKAAIEEATRDGADPIDLVDGDQFIDKLKELSLGVRTQQKEEVVIDSEWFLNV